ncbi:MAG: hypothetical protein ABI647_16375 [Gemmatimonadota bacterium]
MRSALVTALLIAGVTAGALAQDSSPPKITIAIKKQPNVITLDEIRAIRNQIHSARDIVDQLRPQFLRNRVRSAQGASDWTSGPRVLVDDVPYGDIESLRTIDPGAVHEIRYVSGPEAASRYGADFNGGVILVLTR